MTISQIGCDDFRIAEHLAGNLRAQGHKVYAPSLSGLADRSHLLSTSITLDTHIADIVNLFQWEEIENAVLVGHSYGGWPISGAAERLVEKIASIVYVDAFVPANGQRGMDLSSAQFRQALQEAIAKGEAGRPVPDANVFKIIEPRDVRCVQSKMTPQPTFVSTSPIALTGARERIAGCFGARPADVVFTSTASEALATALGSVAEQRRVVLALGVGAQHRHLYRQRRVTGVRQIAAQRADQRPGPWEYRCNRDWCQTDRRHRARRPPLDATAR